MKKLFIYTIMCFLYITLTATTCDDIDYRTVCIRNKANVAMTNLTYNIARTAQVFKYHRNWITA